MRTKIFLIALFYLITAIYCWNCLSAQSLSGGYYHSIAKCTNNSVMAWGSGGIFGGAPLGNNSNANQPSPVSVHGPLDAGFLSSMIAVGAGSYHSLAVKNDNTVWAWGFNSRGELGDNTQTDAMYPVQVVAGASGCGTYLCNITAVYGGDSHTIALKNDNTVWAWGDNGTAGKLGINNTTAGSMSKTPVQVLGPGGAGTLTNITAISAGGYHSIALKNDLTVWTWGNNSNGQLGDNSSTARPAPVQVVGAGGSGTLTNIIAVAGGYWHSLALMNDGTVWAWGANFFGELGNGTTGGTSIFPVQVSGLTNIIAIEAGEGFSLALKSDNTVWAWGDNSNGALGDNNSPTNSNVPVKVKDASGGPGFLTGIIALGAGGFHAMALKNDQTVWDWGYGGNGQLGNNNTASSPYPVQAGSGGGPTLCNVTLLPVELISFSGQTENNAVKLFWSTATEINNDYFAIEHSADGKIFSEIGKINGSGNSSTIRNYEFADESPALQNYYRLSQTDFNGQRQELGIISVKLSNAHNVLSLIVQSNPVSENNLSLNIFSPVAEEIVLSITDLEGRVIHAEKNFVKKKENVFITIDMSDVSKGVYFINATGKYASVNQKFILLNRE
ncbi:MAG: T9SS type A sorting domain-containing protein [Bacteroidetes bacterium]|nr:T9SS type A sorting domain-containing protein [Bacteroidota bacterium]